MFVVPLALAGCSAYEAPELRVVSVGVSERSAEAVVLRVVIDAENANDVALPLRDVEYEVEVGDGGEGRVFRGVRSAEATLRRFGTQQIEVPAVVAAGSWPGEGTPYVIRGRLRYTTPGEIAQILFDAGVRRPEVSFEGRGVIGAAGAP